MSTKPSCYTRLTLYDILCMNNLWYHKLYNLWYHKLYNLYNNYLYRDNIYR